MPRTIADVSLYSLSCSLNDVLNFEEDINTYFLNSKITTENKIPLKNIIKKTRKRREKKIPKNVPIIYIPTITARRTKMSNNIISTSSAVNIPPENKEKILPSHCIIKLYFFARCCFIIQDTQITTKTTTKSHRNDHVIP